MTVGALDNVRYLGQFGEYMLSESFTARDPNRTARALPLTFCLSSHPREHAVTQATDARQSARVAECFGDNVPRKTANRVTWPGLPPFGTEGRGPLLAGDHILLLFLRRATPLQTGLRKADSAF